MFFDLLAAERGVFGEVVLMQLVRRGIGYKT